MLKNNFQIFYDIPEGGGSGSAAPVVQETQATTEQPVVETSQEQPTTNTTETQTDVEEPVTTSNTEETTEETTEQSTDFNSDEITFDNAAPEEFDTSQMAFMEEEGFNISDPKTARSIKMVNELGVTDPKVIANFLRKEKEMNKLESATEIKAKLDKELSPELKAGYSSLNNTLKSAWGSDKDLQPLISGFMSAPKAVKALDALVKHLRGGVNPNPTTGGVPRSSQGLNMDKAVKSFDEQWAATIRTKGTGSISEKTRIVNEISSKMNPTEVRAFRSRYE